MDGTGHGLFMGALSLNRLKKPQSLASHKESCFITASVRK